MKENKTEIKKELEGTELQDNELENVTGGGQFEPVCEKSAFVKVVSKTNTTQDETKANNQWVI